jgi:hypothetical protein
MEQNLTGNECGLLQLALQTSNLRPLDQENSHEARSMPLQRRSLPPLNAVRAFEAAARHGSFKDAAAELGVTH